MTRFGHIRTDIQRRSRTRTNVGIKLGFIEVGDNLLDGLHRAIPASILALANLSSLRAAALYQYSFVDLKAVHLEVTSDDLKLHHSQLLALAVGLLENLQN